MFLKLEADDAKSRQPGGGSQDFPINNRFDAMKVRE